MKGAWCFAGLCMVALASASIAQAAAPTPEAVEAAAGEVLENGIQAGLADLFHILGPKVHASITDAVSQLEVLTDVHIKTVWSRLLQLAYLAVQLSEPMHKVISSTERGAPRLTPEQKEEAAAAAKDWERLEREVKDLVRFIRDDFATATATDADMEAKYFILRQFLVTLAKSIEARRGLVPISSKLLDAITFSGVKNPYSDPAVEALLTRRETLKQKVNKAAKDLAVLAYLCAKVDVLPMAVFHFLKMEEEEEE